MTRLKVLLGGAISLLCIHSVKAQNVKTTARSHFTASGNIGASANFYTSNETELSRQHFSWNTTGNFVLTKGNFSLPVTFIVSQFGSQRSAKYSQFGISPTYKWATLYLGDRYISMSPFIFQGQSFRGVGIDLKPGAFRFTAFYGRMNKSIIGNALEYTPLQYTRIGYGVRLGVGNANNHFDLIYFHAKDDSSSSYILNKSRGDTSVPALENTVLGSSFKIKFLRRMFFSGDIAMSGLTQDIGFKAIDTKFFDSTVIPRQGVVRSIYDAVNNHLITINSTSIFSYAGQSYLSYVSRHFNSYVNYRRVAPDFRSLGTTYLINDIELGSINNTVTAFRGRLNINASLSKQHNNLNKNKNTELHAMVGTVNISSMITNHINVNLNYSGYDLTNKEGAVLLPDSLKSKLLRQGISQFSFTPTYNFVKGATMQFISGNINLSNLKNKNPASSAYNPSNKNLSASLSYNLGFREKPANFSLITMFNRFTAAPYIYSSYGATVGASTQIFKRKLNVQGNVGCFINHYPQETQRNFTYSVNIGYRQKHHSFNMYANYIFTPYNTISTLIKETFSSSVTTKNLAGGISYNYNF